MADSKEPTVKVTCRRSLVPWGYGYTKYDHCELPKELANKLLVVGHVITGHIDLKKQEEEAEKAIIKK